MQLTNNSRVIPKRGHNLDKYEGPVDPVTKLRHGRGVYHYDNTFFTYQGEYIQGKKSGQGVLKLKDGTILKGTFQNDELNGQAQITYSHGAKYKGYLLLGEKSGQGLYQSMFEEYNGEWKDNCKNGRGIHKNLSTGEVYEGEFERDKPHGKGKLTRWNYSYEGKYLKGQKDGEGKEINDWPRQQDQQCVGRYQFTGKFKQNQFEGEGQFRSRQSNYIYIGSFSKGVPVLYPNQFRIYASINSKNGEEVSEGQKNLVAKAQSLEYELEGDSINLTIETVYQGPEELDPVQPTPEEIENMVKNWQNQNKKNKNPPPMPDFNQPRMKKPELVLVKQESGRTVRLQLLRENQGKEEVLKIDYRAQIAAKRKQNEQLRQQALKKAEEDGGKKGGKKDNKGQTQLKVNLYTVSPTAREQRLDLLTKEGSTILSGFELPDDFPPGKYFLEISSPFKDFGTVAVLRKEINIKSKAAGKKK